VSITREALRTRLKEDLDARYKLTVPQADDGYVHDEVLQVLILRFTAHRSLEASEASPLGGAKQRLGQTPAAIATRTRVAATTREPTRGGRSFYLGTCRRFALVLQTNALSEQTDADHRRRRLCDHFAQWIEAAWDKACFGLSRRRPTVRQPLVWRKNSRNNHVKGPTRKVLGAWLHEPSLEHHSAG
jgi:hypothetical protein